MERIRLVMVFAVLVAAINISVNAQKNVRESFYSSE